MISSCLPAATHKLHIAPSSKQTFYKILSNGIGSLNEDYHCPSAVLQQDFALICPQLAVRRNRPFCLTLSGRGVPHPPSASMACSCINSSPLSPQKPAGSWDVRHGAGTVNISHSPHSQPALKPDWVPQPHRQLPEISLFYTASSGRGI